MNKPATPLCLLCEKAPADGVLAFNLYREDGGKPQSVVTALPVCGRCCEAEKFEDPRWNMMIEWVFGIIATSLRRLVAYIPEDRPDIKAEAIKMGHATGYEPMYFNRFTAFVCGFDDERYHHIAVDRALAERQFELARGARLQ